MRPRVLHAPALASSAPRSPGRTSTTTSARWRSASVAGAGLCLLGDHPGGLDHGPGELRVRRAELAGPGGPGLVVAGDLLADPLLGAAGRGGDPRRADATGRPARARAAA